ncbi:MAG TPA: D-alanine--D-alanine ligase [Kofleriaceae bacterium]|nr:D-alanine--D-alanine ligase [Kofleriaceae bacterium]
MRRQKIGVLMAGLLDDERAAHAAHAGGQDVLEALWARGHDAHPILVDRDLDPTLRRERIEVAFIALYGRSGEDGCVQGLLETAGIPYTGSGVLASALAMNRVRARQIFRLHNLPTPSSYTLPAGLDADRILESHGDFGFPAVVAPVSQTSPTAAVTCGGPAELIAACERAAATDGDLLVERLIAGQRVSVAMLGDRVLGAAIEPAGGGPLLIEPAGRDRLGAERTRGVLRQAAAAHRALGCAGATQVDLVVSPTANEVVLELNPAPRLGRDGLVARVAAAAGLAFEDLIDAIAIAADLHAPGRPRSSAIAEQPLAA